VPVALNYPGVYVEEVASGVRTITGVATSVTAFLGRALRGPVGEPVTVLGYGDFERSFGGLARDSALGYAVRSYFQNGGSQAVIVRLYAPDGVKPARSALAIGGLALAAASPGAWGTRLRGEVDHDVTDDAAVRLGVARVDLFNLTVVDTGPGGATEVHRNLTVRDSARRIDRVLRAESALVRVAGDALPADATVPLAGLDDRGKHEAAKRKAQADLDAANKAKDNPAIAAATTALATATAAITAAEAAALAVDGLPLTAADYTGPGLAAAKQGLYALDKLDQFNLLCIPPHTVGGEIEPALIADVAAYCEARRALFIVDPPAAWTSVAAAQAGAAALGTTSKNAAVFFPRLRQPDPLRENQLGDFAPCGAVAGVFARTDGERGVWKAPAGTEAALVGVPQLSVPLTDGENGLLNPLAINCLRALPAAGRVVWGARTRQGDDRLASEWKYIPVRRLALHIEESLYRGTQWVVFEPNDEPLWAQIRLNVGAFMQGLFRQGAFQGKSPREAYFVKCDRESTTQADINRGVVNLHVGFAPLKPAEFVVLRIQQIAGDLTP
jgi:uncharacterized protein